MIQTYYNLKIIDNGDMAGNINSDIIDFTNIKDATFIFLWTGTSPTGAITIVFSLDGINFGTNGTSLVTGLSGNTGNRSVVLLSIAPLYGRVVYTRTGGSGTLNAWVSAKIEN